jgi:GH15 family glucan-1,4-alpha-glucosidase
VAVHEATATVARTDGFLPIGSYAVLGDGHTVALVGIDGSIDWLCLPTFSDPSVFGAMLDPRRGGRFSVAPTVPYEVERRYLPGTNVLETTYTTAGGRARVTDAMPLSAVGLLEGTQVVRRLEGLAGEVPMRWSIEPRFGYGQVATRVERGAGVAVARAGGDTLSLQAFGVGEVQMESGEVHGDLTLDESARGLVAVTSAHDAPLLVQEHETLDRRIDATAALWRQWVGGCTYEGPWRAAVERSLLTLKLLVYEPSGAIVAAPTTSLPERIEGERNYDYRFAWVRDMSFALDAALKLGMREQAHRSFTWLLNALSHTHPRVQPIYALTGRPPGELRRLDLSGYRGSRPVNAGNAATDQTQLGNYGDLFATTWLYVTAGGTLDAATGLRLAQVADVVCELWHAEDCGIWELEDKRHYTVSKLACWLALDHAVKLAGQGELPSAHVERWLRERDAIRTYAMRRLWSDRIGAFARDADSSELDASALLIARMEFVDNGGPELNGTIDTIREQLGAGGPLLYRYSGMQDEEGAFVACSFWMAEALVRAGRLDEASEAIDGMLALTNDVGLLAEEIDPATGGLRGNFPQALSHQSLLNACASFAAA